MTIRKTPKGYEVLSEHKNKEGHAKHLSKENLTKQEALKRLREVEFFKHQGK